MTKREFAQQCAAATSLSQKQVLEFMDYLANYIKSVLFANGFIQFSNFGRFDLTKRKSKRHYNFLTGDMYPEREYQTITFRPSKNLVGCFK